MGAPLYRGAAAFGRFPMGGIFPIIVGIALVALVVFLIIKNKKMKKQLTGTEVKNDKSDFEVTLKERLAKGEINEDEYDKLLLKLKE